MANNKKKSGGATKQAPPTRVTVPLHTKTAAMGWAAAQKQAENGRQTALVWITNLAASASLRGISEEDRAEFAAASGRRNKGVNLALGRHSPDEWERVEAAAAQSGLPTRTWLSVMMAALEDGERVEKGIAALLRAVKAVKKAAKEE